MICRCSAGPNSTQQQLSEEQTLANQVVRVKSNESVQDHSLQWVLRPCVIIGSPDVGVQVTAY